jgi:hypothetical protein
MEISIKRRTYLLKNLRECTRNDARNDDRAEHLEKALQVFSSIDVASRYKI